MALTIISFNSEKNCFGLAGDLWLHLSRRGYGLRLYWPNSARPDLSFDLGRETVNRSVYFGPNFIDPSAHRIKKQNFYFFVLLFPILQIIWLSRLLYRFSSHNTRVVICWQWREKFLIAPASWLLPLKVIWLECPNNRVIPPRGLFSWFYRLCARRAVIVPFSRGTEEKLLALKIPPEKIKLVPPGIDLNRFERQETIFDSLAAQTRLTARKNFFTVGTILGSYQTPRLETLFQAAVKCLAAIPHLQIVVAGEGLERKTLMWLAQKMGIEKIVWFIGQPSPLRKWLEGFDVYAATPDSLSYAEMEILIAAMASGLPCFGITGSSAEDFIVSGDTGYLTTAGDSETLAQGFINLARSPQLRIQLGRKARTRALSEFNLPLFASRLEKLALEK
jgi:glycosyltransferase involved in cell wall biosynthesis